MPTITKYWVATYIDKFGCKHKHILNVTELFMLQPSNTINIEGNRNSFEQIACKYSIYCTAIHERVWNINS